MQRLGTAWDRGINILSTLDDVLVSALTQCLRDIFLLRNRPVMMLNGGLLCHF